MGELIINSSGSNTVRKTLNNSFSGTATFNIFSASVFSSSAITLVDDAVIIWDYSLGQNAMVTLTDNRLLRVVNCSDGGCGRLIVAQDSVGGRTLSPYIGVHKVVSGGTGTFALSPGGNAIDILKFFCPAPYAADTWTYYWNIENNFT